jgi:hypothetical protein
VLVLVREQHLVDKRAVDEGIGVVLELGLREHVQGAAAYLFHVSAKVVASQDRELVADLSRVLNRVVEAAELAADRLAIADTLDEPELLEVGDVTEVPGKRAEDRRVDGVELIVCQGLDEPQRALAGLGEAFGDALVDLGRCGRRDWSSLPR